ncbi:MAG: pyridoxal phosphate-dependent aminotransferase [Ruminococcaceae bacterium]|nr:pyridoxal phosphate-dependent aminotransferase [Oscillospiraceae bacterium]
MKALSQVASSIAPSSTLAINAMANQLRAEGVNVMNFGVGEPDFNTPEHIKAAGIRAIEENKTRYTPATGTLELRKAVCASIKNEFGLDYEPNQICIASGAKHNVFITMAVLVNPGDEVILPAPYWVTYIEAVKMFGGVPVIVEGKEENGFKITANELQAAITDKTKLLVLNNPSNPTGCVYTRDELIALKNVIVANDIYVMSDEIYHTLVYGTEFTSLATLGEDIKERTIIVDGVSKAYAMTGWRVGYTASNPQIAKAMSNYLSHSTGAPGTMCQSAAVEAISADQSEVYKMREAFDERRKYFVERVNNIEGVSCAEPKGAFYVFMNIKEQLGRTIQGEKIETSADFAKAFLAKSHVAVVPGSAFGAEGYIRWSYATDLDTIREGLDRLEAFIK